MNQSYWILLLLPTLLLSSDPPPDLDDARAMLASFLPDSPEPAPVDEVGPLLEQLGHADWSQREQATQALIAMGTSVNVAMEQSAQSTDPEVAMRARHILKVITRPNQLHPSC